MLSSIFDRIVAMRVMDLPVGKSFLFVFGRALASALNGAVGGSVLKFANVGGTDYSQIAAGLGLAYLYQRVGAVRGFLGSNGAEVLAVTSIAQGADDTLKLTDSIQEAIAKLPLIGEQVSVAGALSGPAYEVPAVLPTGIEETITTGLGSPGDTSVSLGQATSDIEAMIDSALSSG